MNLFDIASEYREQAAVLESLDIDEQTLADTLESISGDLTMKSNNIAALCRNMEATIATIKAHEDAMAERRKKIERRTEHLRAYLLNGMKYAGISKIESPYFTISIKKNPASVDVFDAAQVPATYMRQPAPPPPAVDKVKVKADLNAGVDVPGCRLVNGESLAIK